MVKLNELQAVAWHTRSVHDVEQMLDTTTHGLSDDAAQERLEDFGPNEVKGEEEDPWWLLLVRQFKDPLIYLLLLASLATFLLRDHADSVVILMVVLINTTIGFVQELRARQAMRSLANLSAPHAEVIRNGEIREIESRLLVPGDVVLLSSGGKVPADVRLSRSIALELDESLLTGESRPVRKHTDTIDGESIVPGDQLNMAFAGTVVSRGRGAGVVVRTGQQTELGRIAAAMRAVGDTTTPLQRQVARFSKQIGYAVIALAVIVVLTGVVGGRPLYDMLLTAVALAVSAIPEGLLVVLTITLSMGVRRMARRRAIVRSLPAVETLGSTTVIGSDKTGTLTANAMTVVRIWTGLGDYEVRGTGYVPVGSIAPVDASAHARDDPGLQRLLETGVLANEASPSFLQGGQPVGDPMELALHVAAVKGGLVPELLQREHRELDLLPFEPERRYMASLNRMSRGDSTLHIKGAPEVVIAGCTRMLRGTEIVPLDAAAAQQALDALASRGLRVLAMAYSSRPGVSAIIEDEVLTDCVLAGLVGLEDPVRHEAMQAVKDVQRAGIRVLMLTGDHVDTALAIGKQIGLRVASGGLTGQELQQLTDAELDETLREVDVFARVAPEHKLRIVQRLQAQGEVVAVTGDGVNDAPALRAAHLGIAMGRSGTDVAREASDIILSDDNFTTIAAAVEEGRAVFSNMRKVTFFLLSSATGEVLAILVSLLAGWPLPFLAVQILWINLVTNGLQDMALAVEPAEPDLLRHRPRDQREGILNRMLVERLGTVGILLASGTLAIFWWTLARTGNIDEARTMAMTQMVVFQFFHVFNCRSLDYSILSIPFLSNKFLFVSMVAAVVAQVAVLTVPAVQDVFRTTSLSLEQWGLVLLVGSLVLVGGELDKLVNRWRHRRMG